MFYSQLLSPIFALQYIQMKRAIRVRFAPSPTGPLHIGGVRTALYNYLFAKKNNGAFILRIEDTDRSRYVAGSEQYIMEALSWCGLHFDEGPDIGGGYGPYRQSERKHLYLEYAETLVKSGNAYYAFDTPEELDRQRTALEAKGGAFSYNWENREQLWNSLGMSENETRAELEAGTDFVIRFLSPKDEVLVMHDTIRGDIEINTNILDDKVLFKSDGMPTYHLANIVDDHLMQISHVIRGEEWLPSLPLHKLLYRAFKWESPEFAHLPLIMKPEGKGKLSKRDGEKMGFPVYPLSWEESVGYRESGYFAEAVINFLAMLGWNPGTEQELFNLEELVAAFSLERVHRAGARFDPEKTKWYNHQYLQKRSVVELSKLFRPILEVRLNEVAEQTGEPQHMPDISYIEKTVALLKERVTFVSEFWEFGHYFYTPPKVFGGKAVNKHWKDETGAILSALQAVLESLNAFGSEILELKIKAWIEEEGISFGKVMAPLRLVLVGDLIGPHLFDIMELLGKQNCLDRIGYAIRHLGSETKMK